MTTNKHTAPERAKTMAEFVDNLLIGGTTWEQLEKKAQAEAKKLGVKSRVTRGSLRQHIQYREEHGWRIEKQGDGIKGHPPDVPGKERFYPMRLGGARTALAEIAQWCDFDDKRLVEELDALESRLRAT